MILDGPSRGRRLPLAKRARWGSELFANGNALTLCEPAGDVWRLRRIEVAAAAATTD